MGMFDTVYHTDSNGNEIEIQFKAGDCELLTLEVGSKINVYDGIYYGFKDSEEDGCFVVFNSVIVAVFSNKLPFMFDKWGGVITRPDIG